MSEPYATRREVEIMSADAERTHADLARRIDALDAGGSRGVIGLTVQVGDLQKEVATIKALVNAHDQQHDREREQGERDRRSRARWLVGSIIAGVAAVDGPLVTILLARGH